MRAPWTTERTPPPGPPVGGRAGGPADPAFARATVAAGVVVVVAGTLGTLWLRGWGRVGFEVPSAPWYFSFPFYVFPGPRLDPGWAAAALPVVAATVAAAVALDRARTVAWPRRVAASAGVAAVLALAVAALAGGRRPGGRRSTTPVSTRPGPAGSGPSPPSCGSSRPACPTCRATPPATRPGPWWSTGWSPGSGRG
jgi:hypothetical protein